MSEQLKAMRAEADKQLAVIRALPKLSTNPTRLEAEAAEFKRLGTIYYNLMEDIKKLEAEEAGQ